MAAADVPAPDAFDALDWRLLSEFQRGLPLVEQPFAAIAHTLGCAEAEVLARLHALQAQGAISRVGPVFAPLRAGVSTLAALAVPPERLDAVAAFVSAQPEVNHNYEREHAFNLWFVVTAPDAPALRAALARIEQATGLPLLDLPLEHAYHIDLGFALPVPPAAVQPLQPAPC